MDKLPNVFHIKDLMRKELLNVETSQLLLCILVSAEKREKTWGDGKTLDDRELDAMFVEAVDQRGFCKSSSWSIYSSPGNENK